MPKLIGSKSKKQRVNRQNRSKQIIYGVIITIGVFLAAAALRVIIGDYMEDAAARTEYEELRAYSPNTATPTPSADITPDGNEDTGDDPVFVDIGDTGDTEDTGDIGDESRNNEEPEDQTDSETEDEQDRINLFALSFDELASLNRDFIGWIVAGNSIDYPVVRGSNNDKYINTTFTGNRNTAGAIFMDYRHTRGFDEQVSIIYGHNTRDRTMFSSLANYLDPDFMRNHPHIYITTRDGNSLVYKVFAAKLTDAWDPAYATGFSEHENASVDFLDAPENATRFLLLSTCTRSPDDDERILIFASLI